MSEWLLSPPIAFIIIIDAVLVVSWLMGKLSFKVAPHLKNGSHKAYACGEDLAQHKVQVDYAQFFPFAFFFTILHVITLMVATVPVETMSSFFIAVVYLIGAITGLVVLFRR